MKTNAEIFRRSLELSHDASKLRAHYNLGHMHGMIDAFQQYDPDIVTDTEHFTEFCHRANLNPFEDLTEVMYQYETYEAELFID